jgi:hypothetical protein
MKFVVTVSTYTPIKDGVQAVTSQLTEFLIKNGHSVSVITSIMKIFQLMK